MVNRIIISNNSAALTLQSSILATQTNQSNLNLDSVLNILKPICQHSAQKHRCVHDTNQNYWAPRKLFQQSHRSQREAPWYFCSDQFLKQAWRLYDYSSKLVGHERKKQKFVWPPERSHCLSASGHICGRCVSLFGLLPLTFKRTSLYNKNVCSWLHL